MIGLLVYGSLINIKELEKYSLSAKTYIPVRINGYKRIFNQEPSWRRNEGNHIGVLNLEYSGNSWINALYISLKDNELEMFDIREKGYNKNKIPLKNIEYYFDDEIPENTLLYTYIGKDEKINNTIMPNHEYLNICLNGAEFFGDEFYDDFLSTTLLGNGLSLQQYLQQEIKS